MSPRISVVMCSYNGFPFIKEAVASVMAQTFADWELIISDDGSTDETRSWLQSAYGDHPRVRLFFQQENLGYVANKNFAHRQAKGMYITQLDNDDVMAPEKLALQLAAAEKGYRLVSCGFHKITAAGERYETVSGAEGAIVKRHTEAGYPFWFPSLLVHREVFDHIGYFNEYFSRALGDDVYWTMLANQHYPIYHLEPAMYSYRSNPGSITNDYKNVRKLIVPEVINLLSRQQQEHGTDWLQEGQLDKLAEMERQLQANRRLMAGKYRMCAAAAMDTGDKAKARELLWKAVRYNPFSPAIYRTGIYILRK